MGCVISGTWWTLLIFLFYLFTPIPLLFVRKDGYEALEGETNKALDIAIFFVTGIVLSTFAFPIFIANTPVEKPRIDFLNATLAEFATILFYTTAGLFLAASGDNEN